MIIPKKDGVRNTRPIPKTVFCHLDYLRVSVSIEPDKLHELLMYCTYKYGSVEIGKRWTPGGGAVIYDNKIASPNGISGGFTDNLETEKMDVMIQFSGQYFSSQTVVDQWRLLMGLKHTWKVRCNRIDLAIDDPTYSLIPIDSMLKGCKNDENFSFRTYKNITSGECGKEPSITNYFGSRNSGKMVRIYDHDGESHRFEAEFKKTYSQPIFDFLASTEKDWFKDESQCTHINENQCIYKDSIADILGEKDIYASLENLTKGLHGCKDRFDLILQRVIASIAVTAIDFRDKTALKDSQRASIRDTNRCDYYQEFIEKVGAEIKIKSVPVEKTLEKNIAWMQRSVSKSLSIIRDALGIIEYTKWHGKLQSIGQSKQSVSDLKTIAYISSHKSIVSLGSR